MSNCSCNSDQNDVISESSFSIHHTLLSKIKSILDSGNSVRFEANGLFFSLQPKDWVNFGSDFIECYTIMPIGNLVDNHRGGTSSLTLIPAHAIGLVIVPNSYDEFYDGDIDPNFVADCDDEGDQVLDWVRDATTEYEDATPAIVPGMMNSCCDSDCGCGDTKADDTDDLTKAIKALLDAYFASN